MEVQLPQVLDAEWVETQSPEWQAPFSEPLVLRMTAWQRSRLFAEGRLLGALAAARDRGQPVELVVPDSLPPIEEEPEHPVWRFLRDEPGAIVAAHAATAVLRRGTDIRAAVIGVQQASLHANGGGARTGSTGALLAIDEFGAPAPMAAFVAPLKDFALLQSRLTPMLARLGLSTGDVQVPKIALFAREAVENTREHGLRAQPPALVRTLVIRRVQFTRSQGPQQLLPSGEGPTQAYLDAMAAHAPLDRHEAAFLELTVADAGLGIAAHLSGRVDVYSDSFAAEADVVCRATQPGESSKAASVTGRGQGLHNAIGAARDLRGLVILRSGRTELVLDLSRASADDADWQVIERPLMTGTSVSLLVPWWNAGQDTLMVS